MTHPVGDRLLVDPEPPQTTTKSGLLLTIKDEDKQDTGTVVAVGDGQNVQQFKVGQRVVFQKYGPAHITVKDHHYVVVHVDEILLIEDGELQP